VRVPPVSEVKGRERVPVRLGGFLGRGLFFLIGPKGFPRVRFNFYFFFLLFFFWISDLSFEKFLLFRFEGKQS
jgi:hypothetical protein